MAGAIASKSKSCCDIFFAFPRGYSRFFYFPSQRVLQPYIELLWHVPLEGVLMAVSRKTKSVYYKRKKHKFKSRRRPSLKFFAILLVALALFIGLVVLLLYNRPTVAVERASAEFDQRFDMLVVRDEVVYEAKNYGKTKYIAKEGQAVSAGDAIAQVYAWGYNDDSLSKLLDLQKQIIRYQIEERREDIIDEKLNEINGRIDQKARDIQQAVFSDNMFVMLDLEREMGGLLNERMAYLRSVTVEDDHLRGLYAQESELLTLFGNWRRQLAANEEGVVSFYFDGCELLMNKQNIGSFTRSGLEEVLQGKTVQTRQKDQGSAPLYRVVNENEWYVVLLSDTRIPEMHTGNSFSIVFDDYLHLNYTGVVCNAMGLEKNDGFVYTILIQDNIGPLLGERRVSARLYGVQESLRIPKSCITAIDQIDYVETLEGQFVPVELVATDGDYVLFRNVQGEPEIQLGQLLYR